LGHLPTRDDTGSPIQPNFFDVRARTKDAHSAVRGKDPREREYPRELHKQGDHDKRNNPDRQSQRGTGERRTDAPLQPEKT